MTRELIIAYLNDLGHKLTCTTLASYPKPRKFRKPEPTELLVDVPPKCRKGAPGCQKLRKQWIALQIKEIQTNIGVKVQFCGYLENCARFTCADDQTQVTRASDCELFCSGAISGPQQPCLSQSSSTGGHPLPARCRYARRSYNSGLPY